MFGWNSQEIFGRYSKGIFGKICEGIKHYLKEAPTKCLKDLQYYRRTRFCERNSGGFSKKILEEPKKNMAELIRQSLQDFQKDFVVIFQNQILEVF